MGLESGDFITDLVDTNPTTNDPKSEGDDHLRLIKRTVQQSFPLVDGPVNITPDQWDGLTGMIGAFAAAGVSTLRGWIFCNGQAVDRVDFANLFAVLGEDYGNGDGSTTFNVPDYRGEFLRGTDAGSSRDPDRASRTDRGDGTTGAVVGTKQGDEVESHTHGSAGLHNHPIEVRSGSTGGTAGVERQAQSASTVNNARILDDGAHTHSSVGGNENRPRNVYVDYYIHI